MISPLLRVVEELRLSMQEHQSHLSSSEAATRYAVIDRVLSLLGWDVHNAGTVTPEYKAASTTNARVDYALHSGGKPVALIEAKSLGTVLQDKELEQLNTYCSNKSVRWGILTNGDQWRLMDASLFNRPVPQRVILSFAITQGSAIDALQELIILFARITGQPTTGEPHRPAPVGPPPPPPLPPVSAAGQPLPKLLDTVASGTKCHLRLRFFDGHEELVESWGGVQRAVLTWLVSIGRLAATQCPMPDAAGKKRYLVNTTPQHADGKPYKTLHQLPNGLFYEANYDAADCCRNAVSALKHCGVDPNTVTWEA